MKRSEWKFNMTGYLQEGFHPVHRGDFLRAAVRTLKAYRKVKSQAFDAIAFQGYSGLAVGTLLSHALEIPVIAVRKKESHDDRVVFGLENARSYIIVDDFVSTGRTVRNIHKWVSQLTSGCGGYRFHERKPSREPAKLLAVFTYGRDYAGYYPEEKSMGNDSFRGELRDHEQDPLWDVPLMDLWGRDQP